MLIASSSWSTTLQPRIRNPLLLLAMRVFALHSVEATFNSSDRGKRISLRVRENELLAYSSSLRSSFLTFLLPFSLGAVDITVI